MKQQEEIKENYWTCAVCKKAINEGDSYYVFNDNPIHWYCIHETSSMKTRPYDDIKTEKIFDKGVDWVWTEVGPSHIKNSMYIKTANGYGNRDIAHFNMDKWDEIKKAGDKIYKKLRGGKHEN